MNTITGWSDAELLRAVGRGIARSEFFLLYQPVVDVRTGQLDGFEALVRWGRPGFRTLGPAEFIPRLEELGALAGLTYDVLHSALACARWWPKVDARRPGLRVNVPAGSLSDGSLPDRVLRSLRRAEVEPERLVLEITERGVITTPVTAREICHRLRAAGVTVSLDDFGRGAQHSARLFQLPVDEIKTDHHLLASADPSTLAELARVLGVAGARGLLTTVEGVEREDQLDLALALGVPRLQGHLFGAPQPLMTGGQIRRIAGRCSALVRAAHVRQDAQLTSALNASDEPRFQPV